MSPETANHDKLLKKVPAKMKREGEKGKKSFFHQLFKFFASLKLAIFVLLTLMAVLAAGTFIESYHGTETARILIYQSIWFHLLLLLLGINVTFAALDRLPWKKKHIGFVITHVGIVMILIGSYMTSKYMIDGQMVLAEGETEFRINTPTPLLYIAPNDSTRQIVVRLKPHAFPWLGESQPVKKGTLPFNLLWTADYPKARMHENIVQDSDGPAAVKVHLKSSLFNQEEWLIQNDEQAGEINLGPATLRFTDHLLAENVSVDQTPYLEIQKDKESIQIPLPQNIQLPAALPIKGTPYTIKVTRVIKNGVVQGSELIDQDADKPGPGKNPAVELMLEGGGLQEKHTVFSQFPDFPTVHGMKPSAAGIKIFYRTGESGSKGSHELRFVWDGQTLKYQIRTNMKVTTGEAKPGEEEIPLGWMDQKFQIRNFYPHSRVQRTFTPEANSNQSEDVAPAIRLELESGGERSPLWLRQDFPETIHVNGIHYTFLYGSERIPAGFKLKLKDFRMEQYPGTDQPASYESDVVLKDDMRGVVREATISMNEPLAYNGFHIYQSGYSKGEDGKEISVFSVGKDPGVPLKYLGAIVMVSGTIILFFFRRFGARTAKVLPKEGK